MTTEQTETRRPLVPCPSCGGSGLATPPGL